MDTFEQLEEKLDKAHDEHNKILKSLPAGLDWNQFHERLKPTSDKVEELSRKVRMIMPYTLSDIPDYGDIMTVKEFIETCKSGDFIDYDGSGNYIKDDKMTDIDVYPSDTDHNSIRKEFDKIIWFNR